MACTRSDKHAAHVSTPHPREREDAPACYEFSGVGVVLDVAHRVFTAASPRRAVRRVVEVVCGRAEGVDFELVDGVVRYCFLGKQAVRYVLRPWEN